MKKGLAAAVLGCFLSAGCASSSVWQMQVYSPAQAAAAKKIYLEMVDDPNPTNPAVYGLDRLKLMQKLFQNRRIGYPDFMKCWHLLEYVYDVRVAVSFADREELEDVLIHSCRDSDLDDDYWVDPKPPFVEYSKGFAEQDPSFSMSVEEIQRSVVHRLSKHHHLKRRYKKKLAPDSPRRYREDAFQLFDVRDKHLLLLIKNHLDYFESGQGSYLADRFFPKGVEEMKEGTALFFAAENGIRPVIFRNESRRDQTRNAQFPTLPHYIPVLGFIHSHPSQRDSPIYFAGPSGKPEFCSNEKDAAKNPDDFKALSMALHKNPYSIDTVLTRVTDHDFNVDIYFSDLEATPYGPESKENLIVIDLSVFKYGLMKEGR